MPTASLASETQMLDATKLLANALGEQLSESYRRVFGSREPRYGEIVDEAARLTIERIGRSDALYHDAHHTALVVLLAWLKTF